MSSSAPNDPRSTKHEIFGHMARGSALMVVMRWTIRFIGLVSTLILARLLTPADFGVVAMASLFVGFIELFSFTNFDLALIRMTSPTRRHYDSAWTLQAALGLLISCAIFVLAPVAASYFEDPRLALVARFLALNSLLQGFTSIGIVDFRKNLDFRRDLSFNVTARLLAFFVTVSFALYTRNYWALVAGSTAGNLFRLVLSYVVHPYRPRFDLSRSREILSFSGWMLVFHMGTYLRNRLDTIIVARIADAGAVGTYHVASELSAMPTNEVIVPTGRALFPAYAKLAGDPPVLRETFRRMLGLFFLLVLPACAGVAVVAEDLVRVVLGNQWLAAAPFVAILAFAGGLNGISHVIGTFLAAIGRQRFTAALTWINVIVLVPALILALHFWGILGMAVARTFISALVLVVALVFVARASVSGAAETFRALRRPVVAAATMAYVVKTIHLPVGTLAIANLLADVSVGVLSFSLAIYGLWRLAGRPEGAERLLLEFLQRAWRKTTQS